MANIKLDIPDTRVVVRQPSVIVDRSKLPIQSVAEFALTASYANYAKNVDAVNIGIVGDISASGAVTASNLYAANSLISSGTVDVHGNISASGIISASAFSGSFVGDGSKLTGLVTALRLSGSTSGNDELSLLTDTLIISGANGIIANVLNNTIVIGAPENTVTSSAQVKDLLPTGTVSSSNQTVANIANQNIFPAIVSASSLAVSGGVGIGGNVNVLGNITINGLLTAVSTSFQYVTSSQINIGASRIVLNDDDNIRFSGISIYDSGSSAATASIFWDSQNHKFVYEAAGIQSYSGGILIAGPRNTGALGDERTLISGRIPVSVGGDHIDTAPQSSSLRIDFTTGTTHVEHGLFVTGAITATGGFSGSFTGAYSGTLPYTSLTDIPSGIVSSSGQVDHNSITNYTASRHVDHTEVNIYAGSGLLGGGDISATRILSLDTSSIHFISGSFNVVNTKGLFSSSNQVSYTGLQNIPAGLVSSSTQVSYLDLLDIPIGILSSSAQINQLTGVSVSFANTASLATAISFIPATASYAITSSFANTSSFADRAIYSNLLNIPAGIVSSSAQIDHDATINYTASKHIDHTAVSILAGSGLSGGGNISSTRVLAIDTGSSHFTGGVTALINTRGVISSSNQVSYLGLSNIPVGIVSSSNQVDVRNTTGIATIANTGSNIFKGTQTVQGNIFLSSSFPLVYNNNNTNNMLFGFFDGSQIYGAYYQIFGNNYPNVSQRGGAEFVYDTRNGGDANFHVASFDGSTWIQRFRVDNGGIQVTGSINATAGISGSFSGDGSQLTGIATVLAISGSTSGSDFVNLKSDSLKFSGSNGITAIVTDNTITFGAPVGTVSGSSQIDHNSTVNYTASRHIDHAAVNIIAGNGLLGGGDITDTRTLILDTGSFQFTGGVITTINSKGIFSSSGQVSYTGLSNIPIGIVSSSTQINNYNVFATTGSNRFQGDQIITGSLTVAQNLIVLGSSSINFVSQSTLNIGTNLITVNVQNPSVRFGGLAVIDSGSSPQRSGSILFDSTNDQWVFVHQNVAGGVTSSILVMGPPTFNNVGNETLLTQNRVLKGGGLEHIVDSQITDDGNIVSISNALSVGTSITASAATINTLRSTSISASFISGALTGTFPYTSLTNVPTGLVSSSAQAISWTVATSSLATTASAATSITFIPTTASFALTASYALNALGNLSASWASQSISSSYAATASYVLGATGDWNSLTNKPIGLVSSSLQAVSWSVATSSLSSTASGLFGGTGNYIPLWINGTQQSSSILFQAGSNIGVGTTSAPYRVTVFPLIESGGAITVTIASNTNILTFSSPVTLNAGDVIATSTTNNRFVIPSTATSSSFTLTQWSSTAVTSESFTIERPSIVGLNGLNQVRINENSAVGSITIGPPGFGGITGGMTLVSTGTSGIDSSRDIRVIRYSDNVNGPFIGVYKARGTFDNPAAVQNGDQLGQFTFNGWAQNTTTGRWGTNTNASIAASANNAPVANGGIPTRLTISLQDPNGTLTERMRINTSGSVGIGTTSPQATLHVGGTVSSSGVVTIPAGTAAAPSLTSANNSSAGIFFPATDTIAFTKAGAESMRIDSTGRVGIGTTLPGATLHIQGNVSASSFTGSFSGSLSGTIASASFATTASYALNALGNQSASWASQSISSSYAVTASYALNSIGGQTNSASYAETSSYSVTASYLLGGTPPPAYIFDGGTPSSSFVVGPIFDCGGVI